MSAGMVGAAWISKLHTGGYPNVLFPAYAAICILFGLAAYTLIELTKGMPSRKTGLLNISVSLLCIIQFAILGYNPLRQIPTREDLEAGKQLIRMMQQVEGKIFIPSHNYLNVMAGKEVHASGGAMFDIWRSEDKQSTMKLQSEIREAFREKRFAVVILDGRSYLKLWLDESDFDRNHLAGYRKNTRPVFEKIHVFCPVCGFATRPTYLYYRCSGPNKDRS
jgi:hypothetical protein